MKHEEKKGGKVGGEGVGDADILSEDINYACLARHMIALINTKALPGNYG